ncbi:DegT/DnrJ/EryC1/StrS family aminotransferase [Sphingomonas ginkgonis]|uniref:DegT/DnrJ/EryC1/StrS family aminotransferase n=1 Tax=Sphingomonas ginkgonis TaxID=2315330 RepID=A0A3R9YK88_9SPHN|nr:DegT/DnrJ/EryC1/StrS family aminotransferase [Sphingomonas ginkgonis]RST29460.1 DegT/DnrJ/EryC1/StrS family aminotransferase [Sphingomonas ginkgonis]
MIPFLSLAAATDELKGEIDAAIQRVVRSGQYIGGSECAAFEESFAGYVQASHAVGTGNGLDALHLALRALDVGPGDEVIVAANTFIATLLGVHMTGARPVIVEPDPATHNIDVDRIEEAITPSTKAILPTHLYGQPADLDQLGAIAAKHGLLLVEDAAQAHGASYKGRRIGAHSDAVCWSFYPGKNLGALGDAGAVTTNRKDVADKIRKLGNYGSSVRYVNDLRGVNSRLDPLQAAILRAKLPFLDEWNERRSDTARIYLEGLRDLDLVLPTVPSWAAPSWHLFVILSERRDELQARLSASGIETLIHYPIPPHRQNALDDLDLQGRSFPIAERLADQCLSLPIGPHLSREQAKQVVEALNKLA